MEIKALTTLRFLLAIWVVASHFLNTSTAPVWFREFIANGFLAVPVFFVLSGFVLTINYYDKNYINTKNFFLLRLSRLYPSYILALFITLLFFYFFNHKSLIWEHILAYVAMLQIQLFPSGVYNGPGWSVAIEMSFYLFFPAIVMFLKRITSAQQTLLFITMFGLTYLLYRFYYQDWYTLNWWSFEFISYILLSTGYYLPMFIFGIFAGILHLNVEKKYHHKDHNIFYNIIFAASITLLILQSSLEQPFANVNRLLLTLNASVLIFSGARLTGWLEKILSNSALVYLGGISYGIYIFQEPVRWASEYLFKLFPTILPVSITYLPWKLPIFLLYTILLIAFSALWKPVELWIYHTTKSRLKHSLYKK